MKITKGQEHFLEWVLRVKPLGPKRISQIRIVLVTKEYADQGKYQKSLNLIRKSWLDEYQFMKEWIE